MKKTILASALVVVTSPLWAGGQSISMDAVPAVALEVAKRAVPQVTLDKAGTEVSSDDVLEYELSGKNANGKQVEVDVTADGSIREIESEITPEEVPQNVVSKLKAYLPDFKPSFVEKSQRPNFIDWYEFEGVHNGREIDVEITASGGVIIIGDDAAI